jgi:hypothetical protein
LDIDPGIAPRSDFRAGLAQKARRSQRAGPAQGPLNGEREGRWQPSTRSRLCPEELDTRFGGGVEEGGALAPEEVDTGSGGDVNEAGARS